MDFCLVREPDSRGETPAATRGHSNGRTDINSNAAAKSDKIARDQTFKAIELRGRLRIEAIGPAIDMLTW